ncbi:MAG: HI0074 family nucleotidyltransferase substrate-binding subunit [Bacteroidota bacterium]|nr:HI0074 family nucleotidyltransferase substrate-binding subunit [Bacteroidota bacterium]
MDFEYIESKILEWEKALNTFKRAIDTEGINELERDGAIQRFEYCFELSWKVLKIVINDQNSVEILTPKEAFKKAFKTGLIDNEIIWDDILKKRNVSVHTYVESLAKSLFELLPSYYERMNWSLQNIKKIYDIK